MKCNSFDPSWPLVVVLGLMYLAGASALGNSAAREPLAAASPRTGVVLSEINYHPADRPDRRLVEMIELYNSNPFPEDLSLYRISGSVSYQFPAGFVIPALSFVVLAANPADMQIAYGLTNVLQYSGDLPNNEGVIRLRDAADKILLEVEYDDRAPWPEAADGAGPALVLARPSFGQANALAWEASRLKGGSPGNHESVTNEMIDHVVINEILANPLSPDIDYLELFNRSTQAVDISGCVLSDDPDRARFVFPPGSVIGPRDFIALDEFVLGFGFNGDGETIYFRNLSGTRLLDFLALESQAPGAVFGRYPDGSARLQELSAATPWAPNAPARTRDLVINEIMFAPISHLDRDEFIELHNRGSNSINLAGYQFLDGIQFTFPAGAVIPPGGYYVLAQDIDYLRTCYPNLNIQNSTGNYEGDLSDAGERLAIHRAELVVSTNSVEVISTNIVYGLADEVIYGLSEGWGHWAFHGGSSLELVDARSDNRLGVNWRDSDEFDKSQWTRIDFTNQLDHVDASLAANQNLQLLAPASAEFLVDDIEVSVAGGPNLVLNPGFEAGLQNWVVLGSHEFSLRTSNSYSGGSSLHVRAAGPGDTGPNNVRSHPFSIPLPSNSLVRVRAQARWIAGSPQIELRIPGNGVDIQAHLPMPKNLGTPGSRNSRALSNGGPAIVNVSHSPVLPLANQPIRVTAEVHDPDGLRTVQIYYRRDPASQANGGPMRDDGIAPDQFADDGLYTADIPGQPAGTMVAFHLEGVDEAAGITEFPAVSGTREFPFDSATRECLVRVGEPQPLGAFATYHLWMTAATTNRAASRHGLNSAPLHITFVYHTNRVVYGVGLRYAGGAYELAAWRGPFHSNRYDLEIDFPRMAPFLGRTTARLSTVGDASAPAPGDASALIDQTAQRFLLDSRLPYTHRRYIHLFVNGVRRSTDRNGAPFIMEDTEMVAPPDDTITASYRASGWLEFSPDNSSFHLNHARLTRYQTTAEGRAVKKLAPYRWMWPLAPGPTPESASDRNAFFRLVDAISPYRDPDSALLEEVPRLGMAANLDQWLRHLAIQHFIGNFNSYGYRRGDNTLLFQNASGKFELAAGEIDQGFGQGGGAGATSSLTEAEDPRLAALLRTPETARSYLQTIQAVADSPFWTTRFPTLLDQRNMALATNGVTIDPAVADAMKGFVVARGIHITAELARQQAAPWALTANSVTTDRNLITISGTAPLTVGGLTVSGYDVAVTWTSLTNWSLTFAAGLSSATFSIVARTTLGQSILSPLSFAYNYSGPSATVSENVVISEIMPDLEEPGASFLEIRNIHPAVSFDLGNYYVDGIDYLFPPGRILTNGQIVVLVKDQSTFESIHGLDDPVYDEFAGDLGPGGKILALLTPRPYQDPPLTRVAYGQSAPWPPRARLPGYSFQLIDPRADHWRPSNWQLAPATPGTFLTSDLVDYQPLFLSEVNPNNRDSLDNFGGADPWIEIHNASTVAVNLDHFFLTDDLNDPTRWPLPPRTLQPFEFLIVWADGQLAQTTSDYVHANFVLPPHHGQVALVERLAGQPRLVDYFAYSNTTPNLSHASFPNGQSIYRASDRPPTMGALNPPMPVRINEWMADNDGTILDPSDQNEEDWIELHNPSPFEIDLRGYALADDGQDRFILPSGCTMPGRSFLIIWADRSGNQNHVASNDLHAPFRLSADRDSISIYASNGSGVDFVTYGTQEENVSQGRFPDGAATYGILLQPTPRSPNASRAINDPPAFAPIADRRVHFGSAFTITVTAFDSEAPPQQLDFTLVEPVPVEASLTPRGHFMWAPPATQRPGTNVVTIRVTDDGLPPATTTMSFRVIVDSPPSLRQLTWNSFGNLTFTWNTVVGLVYVVEWSSSLLPGEWYSFDNGFSAFSTTSTFTDRSASSSNRFYRIRIVP